MERVGSLVALWFLIENLPEKNVVNLFRVESLLIEPPERFLKRRESEGNTRGQ